MKKTSALLLLLLYLGVWGDRLALLSDEGTEPLKVFPYRIELYPQADQQALRHGIPITSKRDASQLLEDYFS